MDAKRSARHARGAPRPRSLPRDVLPRSSPPAQSTRDRFTSSSCQRHRCFPFRIAAGRCGSGRLLRLPPRNPRLPECTPFPLLHRHLLRPAGPFSTSTSSVAPNLDPAASRKEPWGAKRGRGPLTASSSAQAPVSLPNVPAAPSARAGPRPLTALSDCRSTQAVCRTSASGPLQIRENFAFRLSLALSFYFFTGPLPPPGAATTEQVPQRTGPGTLSAQSQNFLYVAQCRRPELREGVA